MNSSTCRLRDAVVSMVMIVHTAEDVLLHWRNF